MPSSELAQALTVITAANALQLFDVDGDRSGQFVVGRPSITLV
jgi:hypothetical protein